MKMKYTYSVKFVEDKTIEWSSRWEGYFFEGKNWDRTHWMALVNCAVISLLLTGVVALILNRTLKKDKAKYGNVGEEGARLKALGPDGEVLDEEEDLMEDATGWKLLSGDVFRPPGHANLYPPLVGSGVQVGVMGLGLLVLSSIGVLNPSYRGGFLSFALFLFVFAG